MAKTRLADILADEESSIDKTKRELGRKNPIFLFDTIRKQIAKLKKQESDLREFLLKRAQSKGLRVDKGFVYNLGEYAFSATLVQPQSVDEDILKKRCEKRGITEGSKKWPFKMVEVLDEDKMHRLIDSGVLNEIDVEKFTVLGEPYFQTHAGNIHKKGRK